MFKLLAVVENPLGGDMTSLELSHKVPSPPL